MAEDKAMVEMLTPDQMEIRSPMEFSVLADMPQLRCVIMLLT
jgi:hypothetical protein